MASGSGVIGIRLVLDGAKRAGDELSKFGKGFDKLALVAGAAGLSAGAALVAGTIKAMDFEGANAKMAAQLGLSKDEAGAMGKVAGEVYAGNYGDSLASVNDAIVGITRNIGEGSDEWLRATSANVLSLSSAFNQESGDITKAVGQLLNTGLADTTEQALDVIASGFQTGTDRAGDFLDTLNEYSPQWQKFGLDAATATGLLSQGLQAGARDSDLVADAIKEFSIRAIDGSTTTAAGFKAIGVNASKMTKQIAGGGEGAKQGLDTVLDRLRAMQDPVARSAAAVELFGTQAEDLGAALYSLDPSSAVGALGQVAGAAQGVNDTLSATAASNIESFKRQMQVTFVDVVGGQVLPVLTRVATYLSANFGPALAGVGQWLQKYQGWLIPIVSVLGAMAGAVVALSAVTKAYAAVQAALNIVMAMNPIGIVVIAIAGLAAGLVYAYTHSEKFRLVVDILWLAIKTLAGWVGQAFLKFTPLGIAIMLVKNNFDAIKNAVSGFTDKLKQAFDWVKKLADKLAGSSFITGIGNKVLDVVGYDGARAAGGPVDGGSSYLVGEQGPEMFTPSRSGSIVNNDALTSAIGGSLSGMAPSGDVVVHQTTTLDGKVLFENWQRHASTRMARA